MTSNALFSETLSMCLAILFHFLSRYIQKLLYFIVSVFSDRIKCEACINCLIKIGRAIKRSNRWKQLKIESGIRLCCPIEHSSETSGRTNAFHWNGMFSVNRIFPSEFSDCVSFHRSNDKRAPTYRYVYVSIWLHFRLITHNISINKSAKKKKPKKKKRKRAEVKQWQKHLDWRQHIIAAGWLFFYSRNCFDYDTYGTIVYAQVYLWYLGIAEYRQNRLSSDERVFCFESTRWQMWTWKQVDLRRIISIQRKHTNILPKRFN